MSTRCQMAVYESEHDAVEKQGTVYLYRHSDGYPEGVLPDISSWLRWYNRQRGLNDTSYASARLIAFMIKQYDGVGVETPKTPYDSDKVYGGTIGFGVMTKIQSDIEYFYHISPTKLKVFEVRANYSNDYKDYKQTYHLKGEHSLLSKVKA